MKRRDFLKSSTATLVPAGIWSESLAATPLIRRAIPVSGELLPAVGLGTWQTFDVGSDPKARHPLKYVLHELLQAGGSVVDSSPMYGSSETVVGDLAEDMGIHHKLFKASKVWTSGKRAGIDQMHRSLQRMRTDQMDLMQVHNLLDAKTQLATLAEWQQAGKVRYLGITHYHAGGYAAVQRLMRSHTLDFVQINYSMLSREVEQSLLPLAAERGVAVLINRPFEGGRLFQSVQGKQLPPWAEEIDCASWGQFFLKFILANPTVTCVIPGTSKLKHMQDNMQAGRGRLPTQKQRKAMLNYLNMT